MNVGFQVFPASRVRYIRDALPSPMDRMTALLDDVAWMSRNSNVVAFSGRREGDTLLHVVPELVVRRTVPDVPETQMVLSETGERPRYWRVVFVGVRVQDSFGGLGWAVVVDEARSAVIRRDERILSMREDIQDGLKENLRDFILLSEYERPRNDVVAGIGR